MFEQTVHIDRMLVCTRSAGLLEAGKCSQVKFAFTRWIKTPGENLEAFGGLRFRSSVRTPEEIWDRTIATEEEICSWYVIKPLMIFN